MWHVRRGANRTALMSLLLPLVMAAAATAVHAQAVSNMERRLLPYRFSALDSLPPDFWSALAQLRTEEDRQRSLNADISFGFSGDDAGDRSLYKLSTGITLSRGDFPSQFSVESKLGMQIRDGSLQEDVTTLHINYDYYVSRALEYFTFIDRFTDSFLNISQRYEIGFGARIAGSFGEMSGTTQTETSVDATRRTLDRMRSAGMGSGINPAALTPSEIERYDGAAQDLIEAVRVRESRVIAGLAASIFAEVERADLSLVSVPLVAQPGVADEIRSNLILAGTQRYRLSLRPTLRLRPTRDISIRIFPYYKLPLSKPHRVVDEWGRRKLDYRRDIYSEIAWSVVQNERGVENMAFVMTLNEYFDNVPPAAPSEVIAAEVAKGRVFRSNVAIGRHRLVALSLRMRW